MWVGRPDPGTNNEPKTNIRVPRQFQPAIQDPNYCIDVWELNVEGYAIVSWDVQIECPERGSQLLFEFYF